MDFSELLNGLKLFENHLKETANTCKSKLDRITYTMLVDGLKNADPAAVNDVINQLVKENRLVCIAPLYVVAKAHPVPWVKQQAQKALHVLVPDTQLEKLTENKNMTEAVSCLIEKYGHFRQ